MNKCLICLALFLAACQSTATKTKEQPTTQTAVPNENQAPEDEEQPKPVQAIENDPASAPVLPVCTRFYKEVCLGSGGPDAVENESGYYVLDLESFKSKLAKIGMFTEAFIAGQDVVFNDCKMALEQEKITPEEAWEGGIEMNAPADCGFLDYAYYFNAQEYSETFRLHNTRVQGNTASTEMHYYFERDNGEYFSWDDHIYLTISLQKQNGTWLIDEVKKVEH